MAGLSIIVERLLRKVGSGANPVLRFFAFVLALIALTMGARADTLDWASRPPTNLLTAADSVLIGGVTITTHTVASGTFDSNSSTIFPTNSSNSSNVGIIEVAMNATTDVGTSFQTTTITFSAAVYNLSLTLRDIDGGPAYSAFNDIVDVSSNNGLPTSWDNASGVDYDSATGRASANQSAGIDDETGNITVTWAGPVTSITIKHIAGPKSGSPSNPSMQIVYIDDLVFSTFSSPSSLKLKKTTANGTGTYSFSQINLNSTPGNITTVTEGVPAPTTPVPHAVTTLGSAVIITETATSGSVLTSASCTDANAGTTGNTGSFGTLSGNVLTIPASRVVSGAAFTCTFTNTGATLSLQKISQNGTTTFDFNHTNLASASTSISTVTAGVAAPATLTPISVATLGSPITITESAPTGYALTGASCTDANSGTTGNTGTFGTLAGNVLTIPASKVVANADFICTFTNYRSTVSVQKLSLGNTGTFSFTDTNVAGTFPNIPTTAVNTLAPIPPVPRNVSNLSNQVQLNEGPAAGFTFTTVTCTDSFAAFTGNAPVTTTTLPVTIPAAGIQNGGNWNCVFSNTKTPTVKFSKLSVGGTATFNFTGSTNLASTPVSINTATNNPGPAAPATINITTLGTAATLTEGVVAGYKLTGFSCTDANSSNTGNSGTFGSFNGGTGVVTIPAANVVAGADLTCTITNTRATVSVQKQTSGGVGGPFTITHSNLSAASTSATTTAGTNPTTAVTLTVTAIGTTAVSFNETAIPSGYTFASAQCTDANSGVTGNPVINSTTLPFSIPAANVVAGSAYNCILTNARRPTLQLAKAWGSNVISGNVAAIGATTGGSTNTTAFSSTAPTAATSGAAVNVTVGNTITLPAETFTTGSIGNYDTTLACTADGGATANALSGSNGQNANTLLIGLGDAGKAIVCTYTNKRKPLLSLTKSLGGINRIDNTDQFTLSATGQTSITTTGTGATIATNGTLSFTGAAGTAYALNEAMGAGSASALTAYAQTVACSNSFVTGTNVSGITALPINITPTDGDVISCTITNTDNRPRLTLVKTTVNDNGGTNVDADFTLTATGPTTGLTGTEGQPAITTARVLAGTYTLTESGAATANYTLVSWVCTAGTFAAPNQVTLAAGQNATCTATNNDKPRLTLVKAVTNNNGGTNVAADWNLSAVGATNFNGTANTAAVTSIAVDAGAYTLNETGPYGYLASAWVCPSFTVTGGNQITLAQNSSATCTITNDDIAPTVAIQKTTQGGASTPATFSFAATGLSGTINAVATAVAGTPVSATPTALAGTAGTAAQITEGVPPAGYAFASATCVDANGASTGNSAALNFTANPFTIPIGNMKVGAAYTCTVTNNKLPSLQLAKTTVGAVAGVASTFTFAAGTNANGFAGDSIAVTGSATVTDPTIHTLTSASAITDIAETMPDSGWTATSATCTGTAAGNVSFAAGTLTLSAAATAPGNVLVCTFTNTDVAPRLTLAKTVTNNNGGINVAADWTLSTSGGPTNISGVHNATTVTSARVLAGTYTLAESALPFGYAASAWTCPGETLTGSNVTLSNSEVRTCTITNDDIAPQVALRKQMAGETGTVAFNATQTGLTGTFAAFSATGAALGAANTALLGTRNTAAVITETANAAFQFASVSCTDAYGATNGNGVAAISYTLTGNQFTIPTTDMKLGANFTCTLTNNKRATLQLAKTTVGAVAGVASTFTFAAGTNANGFAGDSIAVTGSATVTDPTIHTLTSASAITDIVETMPDSGWTATSATCTGTAAGNVSFAAGTLTLSAAATAPGNVLVCTFTNTDVAPRLTLAKTLTNDNGGNAALADFTLTASGGPTTPVSGVNGATTVTSRRVLAGTYTLGETSAFSFGYTASAWTCPGETLAVSNVTLSNGEVRTCTITNNDIAPTVALRKQMVGEAGTVAFNATQTGLTGTFAAFSATGAALGTANTALPGARNTAAVITETANAAFTFSSAVCTDSNGAANGNGAGTFTYPVNVSNQFTVATTEMRLAAQLVCILTNTKKAQITLAKTLVNNNGGTAIDTAWTLQAAGTQTISGIEGNVNVTNAYITPGAYTLTESGGPTGYTLTGWNCPTFTLTGGSSNIITMTAGQVATCTATNDDVAARLTITKNVTNDNGGTAVASAFTMSVAGPSAFSGAGNSAAVTNIAVNAGAYTLTETGPTGYAAGAWSCGAFALTGPGSNVVTLAIGETASCAITNNDVAPRLLVKKISNGGTGTFTFSANNGYAGDSIDTSSFAAGTTVSGANLPLSSAGVVTDITEGVAGGFFLNGAPVCTGMGSGGAVSFVSGTTYRLNAAAVSLGAVIECTFTNTLAVPSIQVTKTPSVGSVSAAGNVVTYTVRVSNNGNVAATNITVSDPLGTVTCPGGNPIPSIAAGAFVDCSMPYTVTQVVFDNNGGGDGDIDNTASASGTTAFGAVNNNGIAVVTLTGGPTLVLAKSRVFAPGLGDSNSNGTADVGETITYRYDVTNTGNRTITGVNINTDNHNGYGSNPLPSNEAVLNDVAPLGDSTDAAVNQSWDSLAPGDSIRFTWVYTVVQPDIDLLQ